MIVLILIFTRPWTEQFIYSSIYSTLFSDTPNEEIKHEILQKEETEKNRSDIEFQLIHDKDFDPFIGKLVHQNIIFTWTKKDTSFSLQSSSSYKQT